MNKWQIICPLALFALLVVMAMHSQVVSEHQVETASVARAIDEHSLAIANLLATMHTNDPSEIENAIYQELQTSTSLMVHSDFRVTRMGDGLLKCKINTGHWRLPTITIYQPSPLNSAQKAAQVQIVKDIKGGKSK